MCSAPAGSPRASARWNSKKRFAWYTGAKYAVGLNSCTAGLHLALVALGIGPGDEVITTPITFPATVNVIEHVGARPVFADVFPDDLNINPDEIEKEITPRTKAIIPVHFRGMPGDMDRIFALAKKHNLAVVEDAAHAVETRYKGRKVGNLESAATCFSFYATKNITTGEGGMLTTNDEKIEEKVRVLSLHGISRDAWKRYSLEGYRHWETLYAGYKYNMFDLQAALGLIQLNKVDMFWNRRKEIVDRYHNAFSDEPALHLLFDLAREQAGLSPLCARDQDRDAERGPGQNHGSGPGRGHRHRHPFPERGAATVLPGKIRICNRLNAQRRICHGPGALHPVVPGHDQ